MILVAGTTSVVHFVELTARRQLGSSGIVWPSAVYAVEPETGALTTSEREELQRLRRDNKRLEMEREILKNSPRASSYLLNQKLPHAYSRRGSGGAAGCFLATTAIP